MNTREVASVAAMWWTNKIFHFSARKITCQDGQDPERVEGLFNLLSALNRPVYTKDDQERFEKALEDGIERKLAVAAHVYLNVDYDPCTTLSDAEDVSGVKVPEGSWPGKTIMEIGPTGEVAVWDGYRAPKQIIYP